MFSIKTNEAAAQIKQWKAVWSDGNNKTELVISCAPMDE